MRKTLFSFRKLSKWVAGAKQQLAEMIGGMRVGYNGSKVSQIIVGTAGPMVGGSLVVNNPYVTNASNIFLCGNNTGGTAGGLRVSARTAGTSFTVTSSSGTDTGSFAYMIVEP